MKKAPNGYWNDVKGKSRAISALRKVLLESNYDSSEYPLIVNERFMENVGLSRPYQKHFKSSPFAFLKAVFPGKYMPWEMEVTPIGYFSNAKLAKKAMQWLVEKKLSIPLSDMDKKEVWRQKISQKVTKEVIVSYGLRGLLAQYNNTPEKLMRMTYPDKFLAWDFHNKTKWKGAEGHKLAAKATRWVIEKYAGLFPNSPEIGYRFFVENGLHGMITSRTLAFNSSPRAALKNAYPDLLP